MVATPLEHLKEQLDAVDGSIAEVCHTYGFDYLPNLTEVITGVVDYILFNVGKFPKTILADERTMNAVRLTLRYLDKQHRGGMRDPQRFLRLIRIHNIVQIQPAA